MTENDEIVKYINEDSIRGELCREFHGIISDFKEGKITEQEKEELVLGIEEGFMADESARDEELVRWVHNAVTIVCKVI
jgi:hypothetical protein|tara:strand:+ start:1893 stop:2129 length:237 start_codon:yes stop_codon:yes gene_type:complete